MNNNNTFYIRYAKLQREIYDVVYSNLEYKQYPVKIARLNIELYEYNKTRQVIKIKKIMVDEGNIVLIDKRGYFYPFLDLPLEQQAIIADHFKK